MEDDVVYWKEKYRLIDEHYKQQKARNEELEDRLLDMVEKIESDKLSLASVIDDLSRKLEVSEKKVKQYETMGTMLPTDPEPQNRKGKGEHSDEPEDPIMVSRPLSSRKVMLNGPCPSLQSGGYHHFPVLALDEGFIYGFRWEKGATVKVV